MDDPCVAWPAWKFGMKRDALFTTLHDQYNTFQSTIQDPEAFHHDVYDVAVTASTTAEFHRLLADRREQRLRELNESLESAAFEIIANPALVGSSQWAYALQLFRTRSLDSLVRFFSSYLPADHPWHGQEDGRDGKTDDASMPAAEDDSTVPDAEEPMFHDSLTHEPQAICYSPSLYHENEKRDHELPPSPRSLTALSDESHFQTFRKHHTGVLTPARTLTSDSASDGSASDDLHHRLHDALEASADYPDETFSRSSSSPGPDTPMSMSEFDDSLHVVDLSDRASTDAHASHDTDAASDAGVFPSLSSSSCSPRVGGLVDASTDCKPLASLARCSGGNSTQPPLALRAYDDDRAQPGRAEDCSAREDCGGSAGRALRPRTATKTSPACASCSQRRSPRQRQKALSRQGRLHHQQHRACHRDADHHLGTAMQRRGARRAAMAAWCRRTIGPNTSRQKQ